MKGHNRLYFMQIIPFLKLIDATVSTIQIVSSVACMTCWTDTLLSTKIFNFKCKVNCQIILSVSFCCIFSSKPFSVSVNFSITLRHCSFIPLLWLKWLMYILADIIPSFRSHKLSSLKVTSCKVSIWIRAFVPFSEKTKPPPLGIFEEIPISYDYQNPKAS